MKSTNKIAKEKLDIIYNIPNFDKFIYDALKNSKITLNQFHMLHDIQAFEGYDIYIKPIS